MQVHSIGVSSWRQTAPPTAVRREVGRILLADAAAASRRTLKSILETAGYGVDTATSAAEATALLDRHEYELVLADLPGDEAAAVLEYSRNQFYEPATSQLTSQVSRMGCGGDDGHADGDTVHVSVEEVSNLLAGIAELLGQRADRRIGLSMRPIV